MKRITPETNVFGKVTGYTVSDVSESEIEANGIVSEWYLKIQSVLILLVCLPPLFILFSPVIYFVTRHILQKGCDLNNKKFIVIINKITFGILIYWILSLCLIFLFGIVFLLHYLGIVEIPIFDILIQGLVNL